MPQFDFQSWVTLEALSEAPTFLEDLYRIPPRLQPRQDLSHYLRPGTTRICQVPDGVDPMRMMEMLIKHNFNVEAALVEIRQNRPNPPIVPGKGIWDHPHFQYRPPGNMKRRKPGGAS